MKLAIVIAMVLEASLSVRIMQKLGTLAEEDLKASHYISLQLIGELIVYTCSGVHRHPFTFSKIFPSETAWPIKAKFHVEPPLERGTKVCLRQTNQL